MFLFGRHLGLRDGSEGGGMVTACCRRTAVHLLLIPGVAGVNDRRLAAGLIDICDTARVTGFCIAIDKENNLSE